MTFTISDLIRAARVYVDDDHDDEDAWLDDADWLRLFNVEYAALYPKWVRSGLIVPRPTDALLSDTETAISNVLAIAGIARKDGTRWYPLEHVQPRFGRSPFLHEDEGNGYGWLAYGAGDNLTVEVTPPPSDLEYTAAVEEVAASIDFATDPAVVAAQLAVFDGEVSATEAGTDGNSIQIRFIPDVASGDPYWDVLPASLSYTYHFNPSEHNTADFEASMTGLPFEVTRTSTVNVTWSNGSGIQNSGNYIQFEGGVDPVDAVGNYYVRYYTRPAYFTSLADTVELPYGADERLVLGIADRAGIKSRDVSRKVMEKIQDADAQLNFLLWGRGDGPRVRRLNRAPLRNDRYASPFARDPRYWTYF